MQEVDASVLPMAFDISMAVRRDDPDLQQEINALLEKNKPAIDAILREYHVPLLDPAGERASRAGAD
jgi:mxaJ protein